ncbi:MAG: hypothetical protein PHQ08_02030 [Candidatus Pacebacteria bacterium]|nr:hypothetical protein [Candidatus Paceibacterota bacterium]
MNEENNQIESQENREKEKTVQKWIYISMFLVIAFTLFISFNKGVISYSPSNVEKVEKSVLSQENQTPNIEQQSSGGAVINEALLEIIPTGVPAVYGNALSISYDDVSVNNPRQADATIEVMAKIDRSTELSGSNLNRYIDILYNQHGGISCEFCCGAKAVIFENGSAACGCAHSYAMRGIAKYLILNTTMTDEEILSEVGKWKVLFFPEIHVRKASAMKEKGMEIDYINLTTNENRGMERGVAAGSGGSMVGGC